MKKHTKTFEYIQKQETHSKTRNIFKSIKHIQKNAHVK